MTTPSIQEKTDTAKRLVKNSAWLFLSEILSKVTPLIPKAVHGNYWTASQRVSKKRGWKT